MIAMFSVKVPLRAITVLLSVSLGLCAGVVQAAQINVEEMSKDAVARELSNPNTTRFGKMPWKFSLQCWDYVKAGGQPGAGLSGALSDHSSGPAVMVAVAAGRHSNDQQGVGEHAGSR